MNKQTAAPRPWLLWLLWPLLHLAPAAQAQRLWQLTPSFPEGPKTGLVALSDSVLFTAVPTGLLKTANQGRSWKLILPRRHVETLHVTRTGLLLAAGQGVIYRSADAGRSWDSAAVATRYPIADFAETPAGALFAGSGMFDFVEGYVGDGVFFSPDQGQTWTNRSNGLLPGRFVNQLAADAAGRLYLTVADDELPQHAGLYRSLDNGLSWQHQAIRVPKGLEYTRAYYATALVVRPRQDSLMLSFDGAAHNFSVSLNLTKSLNDFNQDATYWTIQPATLRASWWLGAIFNDIHFARNGDWYSSCTGGPSSGGTLLSKDQGRTWTRAQQGLGFNMYGRRSPQAFVEASNGKILMVQALDERVYWTDASIITSTRPRATAAALALYPNPAGATVRLALPAGATLRSLSLCDLNGRVVRRFPAPPAPDPILDLSATAAGTYVVAATLADGRVLRQRLVKQ